jgi:hypothetical protein
MTTYIGIATSRVDGRAKVTGAAKYAGEFNTPCLAHASVVTSAIAKGRIARIDGRLAFPLPNRQPVAGRLAVDRALKLSATIARFCPSDQRRRCSGPVITSTRAMAPSLALVQAPSFAPMLPTSVEPTPQCKAALTGGLPRGCRRSRTLDERRTRPAVAPRRDRPGDRLAREFSGVAAAWRRLRGHVIFNLLKAIAAG